MTKPFILKNIEKWKSLNKQIPFSLYDYIFQEMQMNTVSTDIYFALLQLYWPTFINHEGHVFLKENFSPDKFKRLANTDQNIEFWMNFLTLDPYFEGEEDSAERTELLSQSLVDIWQAKLKRDFPQLNFVVTYLEDKESGDRGLTFYQKK